MCDFLYSYSINNNNFAIKHEQNICPKQEDFLLHKHKSYELYYFLRGAATFYIEGNHYELNPGDLLILNDRELHYLEINKKQPYERIVLQFFDDITSIFADKNYDFYYCFNNRSLGERNLINSNIVKISQLDTQIRQILKVCQECQEDKPENEILAQCAIVQLLICINNIYTKEDALLDPARKCNPKVEAIIKYVNSNLHEDLSLDEIAHKFFMSKYYLCHIFKENTGFTLNNYISLKRVMYASSLIARGQSTTYACFSSGFKDYSTFYKAYKKFMNASPNSEKGSNKAKKE